MLKQKRAFTLAEIVVTLVVVAVLISVLLPVITKARPDKQKLAFKKAYYVTEKIVYELVNDEDLYPSVVDKVGFDNTDEVVYLGKSYGSKNNAAKQKSKFCELFASKVNITSDVNCDAAHASFDNDPSFTTTDGIAWYMPFTDFQNNASIRVDVNGGTSPNCAYAGTSSYNSCVSPDRFEINISKDGKMSVNGVKEKEYLSSGNIMK